MRTQTYNNFIHIKGELTESIHADPGHSRLGPSRNSALEATKCGKGVGCVRKVSVGRNQRGRVRAPWERRHYVADLIIRKNDSKTFNMSWVNFAHLKLTKSPSEHAVHRLSSIVRQQYM